MRMMTWQGLACLIVIALNHHLCQGKPPCTTNCLNCGTNRDVGSPCDNGYGPVADGSCQVCAPNCIKCKTAGGGKCDEGMCKTGFHFVPGDQTCSDCSSSVAGENCDTCETSTTPPTCLTCKKSYELVGGTCKACAPNCIKCKTAGVGKCDEGMCKTGFHFVPGDQTCSDWLKCPSGYISLASSTRCYKIFNSHDTRNDQECLKFCQTKLPKGRLAFIDTADKARELVAPVDAIDTKRIYTSYYKTALLVGLRRQHYTCESAWVWTDGIETKPLDFNDYKTSGSPPVFNWAPRQPDCGNRLEFCGHIFFDYKNKRVLLNDITCDRPNEYFLCEAQLYCDPNCHDCTTNGVGKCDHGKCKTGYVFDGATKTCKIK